jgi:hypothetical protein
LRGANGSRECAPDDRLRDEAIHSFFAQLGGLLRSARNDGLYYVFAFRFFTFCFFSAFFAAFFGTFFPSALASERPIAIACLRLVTFLPDPPLFSVPALRFFITRSTSAEAFFEYSRAMMVLPVAGK